MAKLTVMIMGVVLATTSCQLLGPPPWEGPVLTEPRTQLTVDQLVGIQTPEFLDTSFYARPAWASASTVPFSGAIAFSESTMTAPKDRASYEHEDLFPDMTVEFVSHDGKLLPRDRGVIDPVGGSDRYWDLILGTGAVWHEPGDGVWNRASFPLHLVGRYVGEVRNCVATFVYTNDEISNVALQCSQETAVLDAQQLGDIRALLPASYEPRTFADKASFIEEFEQSESARIPFRSLSEIDRRGDIAGHFDRDIWTNASTSQGAVYMDGTLYVNPPATRHGPYPYPGEMRHGVFSVTKSMAGALALFYFAERYGEGLFDELIADYVPAFAGRPEWQGVTFAHALNMVTGTRAGEGGDLLYYPLELAPDSETAIENIARFGDFPEAPGEQFNYATTNTFVISYALRNYVEQREGAGVHYWDLVRENVLAPIGAEDFRVLFTRDADPADRIPILGLGAFPTLDSAAKIARLIENEGEHEGTQILNRARIREALGRTGWEGYPAFSGLRYSHSFWSKEVQVGLCRPTIYFMEGLGDNRVLFFPSGLISFQFTDEFDDKFNQLVRAVERIRSSCD
jgi:CubicO group peptidase (beta-lactamase class C family)